MDGLLPVYGETIEVVRKEVNVKDTVSIGVHTFNRVDVAIVFFRLRVRTDVLDEVDIKTDV